ncbi:MAG: tRNA (N(6)-L-threonylcarbamoyladenosine(37)-C(2))-methylthiotransferase [Candidatus Aenigmarchaeota archaeon]|nr:tRNA (N(6)-L-threonylcarbamoyladenosine(37)-C(2))-methylthiotransferase [Candidatus Aenigmarchaeota archaeon]
MKFYLEWYGCTANKNDAEIAVSLLEKAGFTRIFDENNADFFVIFTCIVKGPTEEKIRYRIKKLSEYDKPVIVVGCMPKTYPERVRQLYDKISLVGPFDIDKIVDAVKNAINGKYVDFISSERMNKINVPHVRFNPVVEIVQISSGCLLDCTYCATKLSRGNLVSYSIEDIVKRVRNSLIDGVREIWITSQDNSVYGFDFGKDLADLINKISVFDERYFIRNGMMNPTFLGRYIDKLIEAYKNDHVFKFLHLCVQSGSDKVLCDMKRGYQAADFIRQVKTFRESIPELTLSTDIIVGYPTETESDFEETVKLIERIKPDIINLSKFWPRPLTEAYKLPQLPRKIIDERARVLHEIINEIKIRRNEKWIGWSGEIIVDEIGKNGTYMGRNSAYKPVVVKSDENLFGKFVEVEVVEAKSNYLIGQLV